MVIVINVIYIDVVANSQKLVQYINCPRNCNNTNGNSESVINAIYQKDAMVYSVQEVCWGWFKFLLVWVCVLDTTYHKFSFEFQTIYLIIHFGVT